MLIFDEICTAKKRDIVSLKNAVQPLYGTKT